MSDGSPAVYYAPVLPAEGWTSIDRYRQDYERLVAKWKPEAAARSLLPIERAKAGSWRRRYWRDILYPRRVSSLFKALKAEGGDIPPLHIFDHSYSHLARCWTPVIVHCRDLNHLVLPSLTGLALIRWKQRLNGLRSADLVVAISSQLAGEIEEFAGIPGQRIRVVHHGVDLECYRQGRKEEGEERFPELAALREREFLILNIGTNLPRKNLETIYRAVKVLNSREVKVKLVRVGSNGSWPGEDERIRRAGLGPGDVLHLGLLNTDEVALVCNLCHVLSFASLYEGFGRSLLEAQACGLPLVAANNSCLPEIAGEGALYHEPESAEDLAECLDLVRRGGPAIDALVLRGHENTRRFSWRNHIEHMFSVYAELDRGNQ